ncbi:hypothetical protein Tco_1286518 [Tanacetum coccineum]
MPTKIELTLEQSQQGVSNEVLILRFELETLLRRSLNLPDHRYKRRCYSPIPAKSDSLPHTNTRALKVNQLASRVLILNYLKDL